MTSLPIAVQEATQAVGLYCLLCSQRMLMCSNFLLEFQLKICFLLFYSFLGLGQVICFCLVFMFGFSFYLFIVTVVLKPVY